MLQGFRLFKIYLKYKPGLLIGTSTEITHIIKLLGVPSFFVNEDDIDVVPLVGKITYPFADYIIAPGLKNQKNKNKETIKRLFHEKIDLKKFLLNLIIKKLNNEFE